MELHAEEKVSPLSGCLPSLLQLPAFFLLYHLFSSGSIGGEPNALLTHQLFDAPLGGRWADALDDGGVFGGAAWCTWAFAVVTVVAYFSYRLSRRMTAASAALAGSGTGADPQVPGAAAMGGVMKVMPFMSFFTLVTVAVVPLAAALYVVTSTTWSVIERSVLYR